MRGQRQAPAAVYPPGKTRYPLYRRVGGPQGRSGQVRKFSPPTGIRSPDRPARSESLYLLSYTTHSQTNRIRKIKSISVSGHVIITIYEHFVGECFLKASPRVSELPASLEKSGVQGGCGDGR